MSPALAAALQLAETARRLALAARESSAAVRGEIARAIRHAAPAVDGVLFYDEAGTELRCTAAFGDRFAYFAGTCVARDDGSSLIARALAAGHRVTAGAGGVRPLHPGDGASLAVPLALDPGRVCVLAAASPRELDGETIERIVALAAQAAPAVLIALDREHDRHRAEYDGLTGLLTPRAFRQRLALLVDRARRAPVSPLALVFADTDHFKRWNDRYGHAAGDALLRALAGVLRNAVTPAELVARNGGDEFCVVYTETANAAAVERAERLRAAIAALDYAALQPPCLGPAIRVTASIGVAAFPADAGGANELLECADAAMYHAKRSGRDGVSYAGSDGAFTRLAAPSSGSRP